MQSQVIILGAGITGLSAGISVGGEIFESLHTPGGLCASYRLSPAGKRASACSCEKSYRFEPGGGRWIFGADKETRYFINRLSPVKTYTRDSAVYFPERDLYVPYPLQYNLSYLPVSVRRKAVKEIYRPRANKKTATLKEWLEVNFGRALCEFFFFPFHELYTDGLYAKIAPQDEYKTPFAKQSMFSGAKGSLPAGYNATFLYPKKGLDDLVTKMSASLKINFCKKAEKIDLKNKEVFFADGSRIKYKKIISTLPLGKMIDMAGLQIKEAPLPYTSVLALNIGAKKGKRCPRHHWIYTPESKAGFYRVGFYSNVEPSFLPLLSGKNTDRVGIYVEKAYSGLNKRPGIDINKICGKIIEELKNWGFIAEIEALDYNWIEVAYSWQYPDSNLRDKAIRALRKNEIYQIGRYARWKFQGIAESMAEGLRLRL